MSARAESRGGTVRGAARLAPWLRALLLVSLLFAPYATLFSYDPYAVLRRGMAVGEAFLFSAVDSTPGVVLGLAAVIVLRVGRLALARPDPRSARVPGLLALALYAWGHWLGAASVLAASLACFCMAAAACCSGRRGLRAMAPAAALALLCIPPPAALLHLITYPLQLAAAEAVAGATSLLGIGVSQSGDVLVWRGRVFEVVESCSGLRSALTLTTAALFYVGVFPRTGRSALILVFAAPLLALAANFLRALSLVFVPDSYFAHAHLAQGIAIFALGSLGLAYLDRRVGVPDPLLAPGDLPLPGRGLAAVAALALLLAGTGLLIRPWTPPLRKGPSVHDLPSRVAGFRSEALDLDRVFLGTVAFSERLSLRFQRDSLAVDLLVGEDDRLQPQVSMFSPKVLIPGRGLRITERSRFSLEPDRRLVDSLRVEDRSGNAWLVVYWWEGVSSRAIEIFRALAALDRGPWRRPLPAMLVRLVSRASAPGRAEQAIQAFAPELRQELDAYRRAIAWAPARAGPR